MADDTRRKEVEDTLYELAALAVLAALPEEELPELDTVLKEDDEAVDSFILKHAPTVKERLAEIAGDLSV